MDKFNWKEIQRVYDEQLITWKELVKKFGVSNHSLSKAVKLGLFKTRTKSESIKISHMRNPKTHSQETKDKISRIRKKFLKENPDKVPYVMNHYSKRKFYSEEYFKKCLEGSGFIQKYRFDTYELDFADLEKGIDLEVDGNQHTTDKRIVKHDIKRNEYLLERGWKIIRINWPIFSRLSTEDKSLIVESCVLGVPFTCEAISHFGFDNCPIKVLESLKERGERKLKESLCLCGNKKFKTSISCEICDKKKRRKVEWPTKEDLQQLLLNKSMYQLAKEFGVCDHTIKRWCSFYGLKGEPGGS